MKKNVLRAIAAGKRLDSRDLFEHRAIEIRFNVSNKAEGSVSVKMGKTEVVCGIKMGVAEPYTDHEAEGTMMTSLELTPMSSPDFEYGPPPIGAVETARIIDRGIRESGFIDFKKLCIKEGEKVWSIFIDIATINDDGNLIDAGSLAALLALRVAKFPVYDEEKGKIDFGNFTNKSLPLNVNKMPVTMTFFKIGDSLFIDPTREEENSSDGRLTMEISKPEKEDVINAMQKGGEACLSIADIEEMIQEATKTYKKLSSLIEDEVKKEEKSEKPSKKK